MDRRRRTKEEKTVKTRGGEAVEVAEKAEEGRKEGGGGREASAKCIKSFASRHALSNYPGITYAS